VNWSDVDIDQWRSGADVSMPTVEPKEDNYSNIHCDKNES